MLNKLKLFTRVASLSLLLTPVKAWSEWRVPERVEIVLGTETLASERQAVLVLSAVVGSNLCYASSDLKIDVPLATKRRPALPGRGRGIRPGLPFGAARFRESAPDDACGRSSQELADRLPDGVLGTRPGSHAAAPAHRSPYRRFGGSRGSRSLSRRSDRFSIYHRLGHASGLLLLDAQAVNHFYDMPVLLRTSRRHPGFRDPW